MQKDINRTVIHSEYEAKEAKQYVAPNIDITVFSANDVICSSSGMGTTDQDDFGVV